MILFRPLRRTELCEAFSLGGFACYWEAGMKGSLPGVSAGVGDGAGVVSGVVVSPVPGVSVPGVSSGSGVGQIGRAHV